MTIIDPVRKDQPVLIHIEDQRLNLVFVEIIVHGGSWNDPPGMEGLADLTALNLLRGTAHRSYSDVMDGFNDLGASVDVASHREYITISGDFMPRYMDEFAGILGEILSSPTFPVSEFKKEKALALEDIRNLVNDDPELARHHFYRYLYGDGRDGRPSSGFYRTVSKLTADDCRRYYETHFVTGNVVVVLSGAITREDARRFADMVTSGLPGGSCHVAPVLDETTFHAGRLLIVDKPGRNQAQVVMGHSSISWSCPELFGVLLGNTAFGGNFTSRLVAEIREKRGWSYGVSSGISAGRDGGTLTMRFFPENRDVASAVDLAARLFAECASGGLEPNEVESARKNLVRQYPFRVETVKKRADEEVADLIFRRPPGMMASFVELVSAQTTATVNDALRMHFLPGQMCTVVVGTAAELMDGLAGVFGRDRIDVIDYRHE